MRSLVFTVSNSNVRKKDLIDQDTYHLNKLSEEVSQTRIKSDSIFFQCSKYFPKYYEFKREEQEFKNKRKECLKKRQDLISKDIELELYYEYLVREEINDTSNKDVNLRKEIEGYLESFLADTSDDNLFTQLNIARPTIYQPGINDNYFKELKFRDRTVSKLKDHSRKPNLSTKFRDLNNEIKQKLKERKRSPFTES